VNSADVIDTNNPGPRTLPGNTKNGINSTFGEAGINLTDSGIFGVGTCEHFGAAYLKSRSSGNSFGSELKDFIAPIPVNITNCGIVNIHKQDDLGAPLSGAVFTLFTDNAPLDGAAPHGANDVAVPALTCTTDATGNCSISAVPFGQYWAVETTGVPNHDLAADQNFNLTSSTPNLTISLTFIDPRQKGAIKIVKTAKHASSTVGSANLVAGFTITDSGSATHTVSTDPTGNVCVGNLPPGSATVSETSPPTGYSAGADVTVTVVAGTTCATGGNAVQASFENVPLTNITISVNSQVDGGTSSTMDCGGGASGSTAANGDGSVSRNNLPPGTYNCQVVIDP
jgi:hypothetical protein